MANISTDFSTWSGTAGSNQPDSGDTATVQADLQAIQAALRTIFPSVNAAVTPTHTELNYVDGVTSAIQTQIDAKATLATVQGQMQAQTPTFFTTGGTSTDYTLTPSPALGSLATGHRFNVQFNATAGATPKLAISGLTAKLLKVYDSTGAKVAASATSIIANMIADVIYDGTDYVILDTLPPPTIQTDIKSFTAVHNTPANGFTITLPAGSLQFRSTTLTDGTPVTRTNAAPTTLVVSSGSTLGTANNLLAVLEVRAVDTGSGFVPAVVNIFGAPRNDETDLITTVAEGGAGAADNYAVVYAAAVHSSKPYRVLGYIYSNQPSAGTWTTAFTLVQGASPQFRINSTFSAIRVYTDAGFGSTNTAIRRFSTVDYNFGTAITYNSSATLGDSFTINESGLYAISFTDNFTTTGHMGISQNSSQLTTTILSIATSDIIASATAHTVGYQGCVAATVYLDAGDVIRAHCALSLAAGANNGECFAITKLL